MSYRCPPKLHRCAYRSLRPMWRTMQRRYARGMDARLAVRVPFPEREHDSKKESFEKMDL